MKAVLTLALLCCVAMAVTVQEEETDEAYYWRMMKVTAYSTGHLWIGFVKGFYSNAQGEKHNLKICS